MRTRILLSAFSLLVLAFPAIANDPPRLVVYISVDQMRDDYLDRYSPYFTGGFRSLMNEGTRYTDATLNYASSVTCLGHSVLGTGCYPSTSGIMENEWVNPITRKRVYCVEDSSALGVDGEGGGSSPQNLLVTGVGDWLKAASPASKVIAVSGKDRAAILMGGKHPDYAFWYKKTNGHMVTSDYYTRDLPEWVERFNGSEWVRNNVPDAWTKLLSDSVYEKEGPDDFPAEAKWDGSSAFPHRFSPSKKNEQILTSPYGDLLVLDFAREAIVQERLGRRGVPDILCISLSDCDYIGHAFGPNSHEIMDHFLRLDLALGRFLAFLDSTFGRAKVLVALSADHGVMPLPEYLVKYGHTEAHRVLFRAELKPVMDSIDAAIRQEWGMKEPLFQEQGFLNYSAALRAGRDSLTLEKRVGEALKSIPCVADVYFRRELAGPGAPPRPYLGEFRRSYYAPRGEDFQVRYRENYLIENSETGTSHGSVYRYDTHVPILFWGDGLPFRSIPREVHTVDIAPTISRMLTIEYPRTVDGAPLEELK